MSSSVKSDFHSGCTVRLWQICSRTHRRERTHGHAHTGRARTASARLLLQVSWKTFLEGSKQKCRDSPSCYRGDWRTFSQKTKTGSIIRMTWSLFLLDNLIPTPCSPRSACAGRHRPISCVLTLDQEKCGWASLRSLIMSNWTNVSHVKIAWGGVHKVRWTNEGFYCTGWWSRACAQNKLTSN